MRKREEKNMDEERCITKMGKCGEGAFGVVYSAIDETEDDAPTPVAIKRQFIAATTDFCGTIRETDVIIRFRGHPAFVYLETIAFERPPIEMSPLQDPTRKDDKIFPVFEHATHDAFNYIYHEDRDPDEFPMMFERLLLGVEYAHAKGMLHRDIKPANLLIFRYEDGTYVMKLTDFGLSKMVCANELNTPRAVTSWYRSPEVCRDEDYGFPADLWSVGCVFYEFAARKPLINVTSEQLDDMADMLVELIPEDKEERRAKLSRMLLDSSYGICGDDSTFIDLLVGLLDPNPETRLTATQAVDHLYFATCKRDIKKIRKSYPPVPDESTVCHIKPSSIRTDACEIASQLFEMRTDLEWYRHRILFQALDLFDRYCKYADENGIEDSSEDGQLKFLSCLYLCIKYYLTLETPPSYGDIVDDQYKTPEAMKKVEDFEETLFQDVCGFMLYRPTLYEMYTEGMMTEEVAEKLFRYYVNPSLVVEGKTAEEMTQEALAD